MSDMCPEPCGDPVCPFCDVPTDLVETEEPECNGWLETSIMRQLHITMEHETANLNEHARTDRKIYMYDEKEVDGDSATYSFALGNEHCEVTFTVDEKIIKIDYDVDGHPNRSENHNISEFTETMVVQIVADVSQVLLQTLSVIAVVK